MILIGTFVTSKLCLACSSDCLLQMPLCYELYYNNWTYTMDINGLGNRLKENFLVKCLLELVMLLSNDLLKCDLLKHHEIVIISIFSTNKCL